MKKLLFILSVLLLTSCSYGLFTTGPDADTPISYDFETLDEIWQFVAKEIRYENDMDIHGVAEYWQTPLETVQLRTGDCEDASLLMMHLLNRIGTQSKLVLARSNETENNHAMISIQGMLLEPFVYNRVYNKESFTIYRELSYVSAMQLAGVVKW